MKQKQLIKFLIDRRCISVKCLEEEAGLPPTTLSKFKRGERELNDEHLKKLIPVLKKYGYQE